MAELKERLTEALRRKLDYYDVVEEDIEAIDYGTIIDALFEEMCKIIRIQLLGGG